MSDPEPQPATPRPTPETLLGRALRLRCPKCGEGKLFVGWFTMPERCSVCRLKYERAPGYFLGSSYINYALTAVSLTFLYVSLHFGLGWSNQALMYPLIAYCVLFPLAIFRHARSLWLAIDCYFDKSILAGEE